MTVIALLLVAAGTVKAQQWRELHTGVTEDLYDICCIDTSTVFVCGQNGVILKTTDGGESWEEKYRQPGCQMIKICFVNPQVGYVLCDSNISTYSHTWSLLKTEDGGETWQRTGTPQNSSFYYLYDWSVLANRYVRSEMAFNGTDTIVAAISYDGVYRSLNGGVSFEKASSEDFVPADLRGLYLENNIGYLLWGGRWNKPNAGISKTDDGGETWHCIATVSDRTSNLWFAHFHNREHVRLFGSFFVNPNSLYSLLETQTGFNSFEMSLRGLSIADDEEFYINSCFSDHQNGMALIWSHGFLTGWDIYYTQDDGTSWTAYSHSYPFNGHRLYDVDGIDTVFFISGENGLVAKNRQFTLMDIDEQDESTVSVYPNPMVDKLFVICKEESDVTLFSSTGQMLFEKRIVSETIAVSGLEPGLYLIRIENTEGISHIKKLIKKTQ